jgi:hypothetical protein
LSDLRSLTWGGRSITVDHTAKGGYAAVMFTIGGKLPPREVLDEFEEILERGMKLGKPHHIVRDKRKHVFVLFCEDWRVIDALDDADRVIHEFTEQLNSEQTSLRLWGRTIRIGHSVHGPRGTVDVEVSGEPLPRDVLDKLMQLLQEAEASTPRRKGGRRGFILICAAKKVFDVKEHARHAVHRLIQWVHHKERHAALHPRLRRRHVGHQKPERTIKREPSFAQARTAT